MKTRVSGFALDRRGNFSIIAAIAAVPLVMVVGMALDLASITRKKSDLQQATDAAGLAIVREGKHITDQEAYLIAKRFLDGTLTTPYTNLKVTRNGTQFTVQADIDGGTQFGSLFGYKKWPVTAKSTADIAYASYEVALVLDTTGSMKGGKLAAMKDATLGLIESMAAQVNDEDKLKFALVPFANFVNVGAGYGPKFDSKGKQIAGTGAAWLDLYGQSELPQSEFTKDASRFQIYANLGQEWRGCVETRYADGNGFDVGDQPATTADSRTLYVPAFAIDEPDTGYANSYIVSDAKPHDNTVQQKKKRWNKYGVATDASGNPKNNGLLDPLLAGIGNLLTGSTKKTIAIDTSISGGLPKGPGRGCDMQPITPLTNDYAGLKAKVNALNAAGTTNITEGVAWGTRVISPGEPFNQGKDKKTTGIEKIMIVLTDGSNVFGNNNTELGSSYASSGYLVDGRIGLTVGSSSDTNTKMNARTLAACDVAKAAGTEVYTIRLEEPNVTTGNMLMQCATDADHYFDVPTRTQLDEAFKKIREKIVRVRLSS